MNDKFGRTINYLRISVTDRCNLRCRYCMPEEGTELFSHEEILTLEEMIKICKCGQNLGIHKIKLTGGEPLVRKNITWLVEHLSNIPGIQDVTMTTNGILLKEMAKPLKAAGLSSVNVSLDTLNPERFAYITRRNQHQVVLDGIQEALQVGLQVKINCAVMADFSLEEVKDFADYAVEYKIPVRFIEMMPIGQGRDIQPIANHLLLEYLKGLYEDVTPVADSLGNGPAIYYRFSKGDGCIGFISAVYHGFCQQCNRVRLTSDGFLKTCLARNHGIDLRDFIRKGATEEELQHRMKEMIVQKPEGHDFANKQMKDIKTNMNRIGG